MATLHSSCLENPMNRGAWQATAHRATKSQTRLSPCLFWDLFYLPNSTPLGAGGWVGSYLDRIQQVDRTLHLFAFLFFFWPAQHALPGVGQWASYVSIISHLLLYLPDIVAQSCSLSPILTHLYALHTTSAKWTNHPREPWHFLSLIDALFQLSPLSPQEWCPSPGIKTQLSTLKPRTARIQLPFTGKGACDLRRDKLQGVKKPPRLWST